MRRALVVGSPGGPVAMRQRPDLAPGPDEVVARPRLVGVCGTDLELIDGTVDAAYTRYPLVLGHEWTGVIERVGADVAGLHPGDAIVAEGVIPCGRCDRCRVGRTNLCATYDEVGFTRDGAASDQVLVPARLVHPLGGAVDPTDAVLAEPAAVVMQGLTRVRPEPGMSVLVVGAGTIALLTVMMVRLWSPGSIAVLGRRAIGADLARAAGATAFGDGPRSDPRVAFAAPDGFDLVIEAAGTIAALEVAVGAARRGGTILALGLPPTGERLSLQADRMLNDDLALIASFSYTSAAWARVVELLRTGVFRPGSLVTHRYPLERHPDALAALRDRSEPTAKVVLEI